MLFVLLALFPRIDSFEYSNSCAGPLRAKDTKLFSDLIDYLNYSLNYKVDPCEDFYQFACGNWIAAHANATLLNWGLISPIQKMHHRFLTEQKKVLTSKEGSKSEAITQARNFYHTISFHPSTSLFSFLGQYFTQNLQRIFTEFLLRLMKLIAADTGVNYSKTNVQPDILALRTLIEKLHSIAVPNMAKIVTDDTQTLESKLVNLSQVDETTYKVNWTEYFLLVTPPTAHSYILEDPLVAVPSAKYVEEVNQVLNETSPRTLTNYVMVHYILSWLPLLEKKYLELIEWFSAMLDHNFTQNRSEICYAETSKHYSVAMLAMYARSRPIKTLRPLAEGMVREIINGLTDQIKENKWMDEAFKKAVLGKVSRISWSLLDDDLFINDTALDELYAAHYGLSDRSFLDMLEIITHIEKTQAYLKLLERFDVKSNLKKFSVVGYQVNAFYQLESNNIMVPLPFLEFPVFHESFPRSYLYGSIGSVIGHEISHSLDVTGRMYDENGDDRVWWTRKWTKEYDKRAHCYVAQYENIKIPKFNISLNGTLTLGENTADNEGLKIAYRAYQKHFSKLSESAETEAVDGFTQDQLFFLGFSQLWCSKTAEFTLYEQLFNPHPPLEYRMTMAAMNSPSFATAFHCSSKSKMNPRHRLRIQERPIKRSCIDRSPPMPSDKFDQDVALLMEDQSLPQHPRSVLGTLLEDRKFLQTVLCRNRAIGGGTFVKSAER
ncbi:hypothetical protein GCK32_001736 [Trichostrongylus colubriformis]|uniref:Uncharacterized protein n=1 Tax=Trichostrongylus colubriformis TaxID=6319 RepID=A0AAN8FWK5_TRICO